MIYNISVYLNIPVKAINRIARGSFMFKIESDTLYAFICKFVIYALPLIGILCLLGTVVLGQFNLSILAIYLVIPVVLAPIVYYKYYRAQAYNITKSDEVFKLLVLGFLAFFIVSIILIKTSPVRPLSYYAVIAIASVFILLEIVLFNVTAGKLMVIFTQIAMFVLNIIWGVTLDYYYFFGRTDVLAHAWFTENLLSQGHVTEVFGVYEAFPFWHILISAAYSITGVDFLVARMMFIVSGLVYAITPVAIYLVATKIIGNKKIALITSLFVSFQTFFIFDGMYSIARSIVLILMVSLILLLLESNNSKLKFSLAIFLTLGIILYHTISIVFVLLILLVLYVLQNIFIKPKAMRFLTAKYFAISVAMVALYWGLAANNMLQALYQSLIFPAPQGPVTSSIVNTPVNELANYLQYIPMLLFIIVGIIYILRSKHFNDTSRNFALATLLFIPLIYPGPVLLLNTLSMNFNIDRFHEYGFLFVGMTAAIGFAGIFFRAGKYGKACLVALFAILVVLSISNDFVASDNPLVKRPFFTYYLTESEVAGIDHIANATPPSGYLLGDYIIKRFLDFSPEADAGQLIETGQNKLPKSSADDILVVRERELDQRPLDIYQLDQGNYKLSPGFGNDKRLRYYNKDSPIWSSLGNYSRIYDSNSISGYR